MTGITNGFDRIIIETDEENPVAIAEITSKEINVADGYRVRMRPVYTTKEKIKAYLKLVQGGEQCD